MTAVAVVECVIYITYIFYIDLISHLHQAHNPDRVGGPQKRRGTWKVPGWMDGWMEPWPRGDVDFIGFAEAYSSQVDLVVDMDGTLGTAGRPGEDGYSQTDEQGLTIGGRDAIIHHDDGGEGHRGPAPNPQPPLGRNVCSPSSEKRRLQG